MGISLNDNNCRWRRPNVVLWIDFKVLIHTDMNERRRLLMNVFDLTVICLSMISSPSNRWRHFEWSLLSRQVKRQLYRPQKGRLHGDQEGTRNSNVSVNVFTHSWPKKIFIVFNLPNFRYNQRVTVAVRYEIWTFSQRVSIISFINVSIINLLLKFY